jgi:endonuclease/exonuclease/phosphatase family metal-dependent hydrolase
VREPSNLRVATWNVHGLRADLKAIAAVIRGEELDVVLLQESGPRRRLRRLGRMLGWQVIADPRAFPRRRVQNAILTRRGVVWLSRSRLIRFAGGSFRHPRGVLIAEIAPITDAYDQRSVASAHLGLDAVERGRHAAELRSLIQAGDSPLVLGADLNVRPGQQSHAALASSLTDVWEVAGHGAGATYPSHAPTARIDYLFVGPAVRALRAWNAGGTVSDHLMVVADLRLS